jgi:hypothetical protein
MIYRQLDNNLDYVMGRGPQNFISGVDAVAQAIKTRLKLLANEWWEDSEDGITLFQNILGQSQHLESIDLIVQERILGTPNVLGIQNFIRTFENRKYSVTCNVDTSYGEAILEVKF